MSEMQVRGSQFSSIEMDREQSLAYLRTARIGRVVLSVKCLPVALPVNLAVYGDDVLFVSDSGAKVNAAIEGQVISVEADDVDPQYCTGWSVLVTGRAELVTDQSVFAWARSRLRAWAPGPHPFLVKVPSTHVSGRQLVWHGPDRDGDPA